MNKTLLRHSVEHTSQDEPPVDMLVENLAHSVDQNSHKDGSLSWIAWSNKPILDEEGEIKEILSIGQDMTAQKALEASLSDAKEVAESGGMEFIYAAIK